MKTLYIECKMGAAGDMLISALSEIAGASEVIQDKLNAIGIEGVRYDLMPACKCGITGTYTKVSVDDEVEDEDIHDDHVHGDHDHHHTTLEEIHEIIRSLNLSDKVKRDVMEVYKIIAEAESKVHGTRVEEVHFHEVGMKDAIADIAGVCLLMEEISPEMVIVSPIHLGSGTVKSAHGILPVPAPATASIIRGIPVYSSTIEGELCTPTGAALLKYFAGGFGNMPVMTVDQIGYGMGTKDFERANCVRVMIGETSDKHIGVRDSIAELKCNIDDMTGEEIGFATETLLNAGALDVFTTAIGMKKNRPGVLLTVLCREESVNEFAELIFANTTTIGIRMSIEDRFILERHGDEIMTEYGRIRTKVSEGYGVRKVKPEYEDIAGALRNNNKDS
ncbi:MAG: nickel pincer cofactor biosynthesis protein LarC [Lachnospiraceae bacterium]|nr:nickel pincer cofactor biosynthesis protein LarC [Lachnospiraceae bacterium]